MSDSLKVLVVDDCQAIRLRMAELLEPYGLCAMAKDGYEAYGAFLDALRGPTPFDLVIMDVVMPDLDGPGAVRLMREAESELDLDPTPVLMLSSIKDDRVVEAAQYEAGADGYLTKPITHENLHEALAGLGLAEFWGPDITDLQRA